VDLRGFTYERISVDLSDLLPLLTPFDRQPYSQLESALRKVGDDQRARGVYLRRRRAERRHKLHTGRPFAWALDWLYKLTANYGIRPLRLIFFALALVLVGANLFEQEGALKPVKDQGTTRCSIEFSEGVAVSVHYFLPMEVPAGSGCAPSSARSPFTVQFGSWSHTFWLSPSWYATTLRIVGAVLIGIGLAAVTGLLRRIAQ
jgi:hypothetical protein